MRWALGVWVLACGAWAQTPDPGITGPRLTDLVAARNIAMGGAYMALGYGTEAIGGNPAALSLYQRYQFEASGAYDFAHQFGMATLGVVDSATSQLAMGLSYHFATYGAATRRWGHVTTLALAFAPHEKVHLGLSARHYGILGATDGHTVTLNPGIIIKPIKELSFGLSGHNLILGNNPDVHRYFVLSSAALIKEQFTPAIDVRLEFVGEQPRVALHGGVEWLIAETVPVRLGYQADFIRNHQYLSFGVGYFVEGSGVDVAYRHEFGGELGRLVSLTLKLQLKQE